MRYRLEVEFDGPEDGEFSFHPAIFKYQIEKFILKQLDQYDEHRRQSLEKLYNFASVQISKVST